MKPRESDETRATIPWAERTLILGLGNRLMADDALGLEAVGALEAHYELPEGVDTLDGGTGGLPLLGRLGDYGRVLVVDCVALGHAPGTVVRVEGTDVPRVFSGRLSPHQLGLVDVLGALELQGRVPERLTVLGVEPERVELGLDLSPSVRESLPRLVEAVENELVAWGVRLRPRAAGP